MVRSPQRISRGRPWSQSVRTRTSTGSTRIIAIVLLLLGGSSSPGALGRQNTCSTVRPDCRSNTRSMSSPRPRSAGSLGRRRATLNDTGVRLSQPSPGVGRRQASSTGTSAGPAVASSPRSARVRPPASGRARPTRRCRSGCIGSRPPGSASDVADEPRPRQRPAAVLAADRVLRLDRGPPPRVLAREEPHLGRLAEAVRPHAEEADPPPAHLGPGELERRPVDRVGQVGRLRQRPLAGDRAEGRLSRTLTATVEARTPPARSRDATPSASARSVRSITSASAVSTSKVCSWLTDFAATSARDRRRVDPQGPLVQRGAVRAQPPHEHVDRQRRQVADRAHAVVGQGRPRLLADAPQAGDRQRREERRLLAGRDDDQPVGLAQVRGDLGDELRRRDPDAGGQPDLVADGRLDPPGDRLRRAEQRLATRRRRGTPRRSRPARGAA